MMVLVHVILFFSRLRFGVKFSVLGRRVRHDYKWFILWILGLGVNVCFACSVVRPRQITMPDDRLRFRQRRRLQKVDRVVLAGYKLFCSSLKDSVSPGGAGFDNNAGY